MRNSAMKRLCQPSIVLQYLMEISSGLLQLRPATLLFAGKTGKMMAVPVERLCWPLRIRTPYSGVVLRHLKIYHLSFGREQRAHADPADNPNLSVMAGNI